MSSAAVIEFDPVLQACQIIHDSGGQVYLDGKPVSDSFSVAFSCREQVLTSTLKSV
jgi:glycine cleavage system protein P-like pyridoxal-binding family